MKKITILVLVFLLLSLSACSSGAAVNEDESDQGEPQIQEPIVNEPVEEEPEIIARYEELSDGISPLTGLPFDGDYWPVMVQLENTSAARPQSGISAADLFYEMEVEAKITRLTAFFHKAFPDKVGPVRSARRQQIIMWSEWNYTFAFYGGTNWPGQNVWDIRDIEFGITAMSLDGIHSTGNYFRSTDRSAPHNAYLKLSSHVEDALAPDRVRTLYYQMDADFDGTPVKVISFDYTSKNQVRYEYDEQENIYKRFINGDPMIDKENGEQIAVTNIIMQRANHFTLEGGGRVYTNIDQIGSGEAIYFSQGMMKTGTWKRESKDALTVYYDENGEEICFPAGKTFIQIIRNDLNVNTDN